MKKCPVCGAVNQPYEAICSNCGSIIGTAPLNYAAEATQHKQSEKIQTSPPAEQPDAQSNQLTACHLGGVDLYTFNEVARYFASNPNEGLRMIGDSSLLKWAEANFAFTFDVDPLEFLKTILKDRNLLDSAKLRSFIEYFAPELPPVVIPVSSEQSLPLSSKKTSNSYRGNTRDPRHIPFGNPFAPPRVENTTTRKTESETTTDHSFNSSGICTRCGLSSDYTTHFNKLTCHPAKKSASSMRHRFNRDGICTQCGLSQSYAENFNRNECLPAR
jgi:transcription initiation factor TFIIIB Brf1 subunit/transcription initiation factor TFIIB